MVQLVSVAVPSVGQAAASLVGGVAADSAVGQRGRAEDCCTGRRRGRSGGVAADGAVGQRGRAAVVVQAAAVAAALPPVIVSPEIDAVTPPSTWNTRLSPPPLTVTPAFGPVIVSVPLVSLSSSWVPVRVIVCGVLNTVLSKVIVSAPPAEFAWPTAQRSVPTLPSSACW